MKMVSLQLLGIFSILISTSTQSFPAVRESNVAYFGENCNATYECVANKGLQCSYGICKCSSEEIMTYDWKKAACCTKANARPKSRHSPNCVSNAQSSYYDGGVCLCDSYDYAASSDGLCVRALGRTCEHTYDMRCGKDMICKNGVCQCRFSGQHYENGRCISKVGQPCIMKVKENRYTQYAVVPGHSVPCTNHSVCVPRSDNKNVFECQCLPGFVEVDGECKIEHGGFCGSRSLQRICDPARNLSCINGHCDCPVDDYQYYDSGRNLCRGLVGAQCNIKKSDNLQMASRPRATKHYTGPVQSGLQIHVGGATKKDESNGFCTNGASCLSGICTCEQGYSISDNRHCVKTGEAGTGDVVNDNENNSSELVDPLPTEGDADNDWTTMGSMDTEFMAAGK